ncbi:MAG: hypothetical protein MR355_08105 [Lachnospiraceae bacterium]|nr:hypothetical protein [Lachnospiraceae bacterium]
MHWYDKLYVGESIQKGADRLRWKIEHRAGTIDIYLLTFPSNRENLLDIIPAVELMQKSYPRKELFVIGMERGRDNAMQMAADILDEVYHETGSFDVRSYILSQEET